MFIFDLNLEERSLYFLLNYLAKGRRVYHISSKQIMKYLDFNSKKLHKTFNNLSKKGFITKNRRGLLYKITFIKVDDLPYETINLNITHPAVNGFYNTLWLLRDKDNVFCIPFNLAFKQNQHAAKTMLKEFIKQRTVRKISKYCIQFCIS